MFAKVLIANRGEIACRVIHTARRMGVATAAVYSEADRDALHVRLADDAIEIGAPPAAESYLVSERIIAAAKETGAEAIHPGYGFLSENADFAEACREAGLTFIGPDPETIRAMGSKIHAKDLMTKAGVPVAPGYQGADQAAKTFAKEAKRIGYPVLLKPSAGGGGKGMRHVSSPAELEDAVSSARREAQASFGDDQLLLEKYIERPRHVEVQVFGDRTGRIVHLYDRDCSVQRRHQKIIEEAPAPDLPDKVRKHLHKAAVAAAKTVNYVNAGTVEFLYDGTDDVYFMEMNTRLQVEHPVTELVTGLDLVEWQLRIAAGEPLPLAQDQIPCKGHAFEARLYAEIPEQGFLPSTGRLWHFELPAEARVDTGVEQDTDVTPHYDPMLAKIVTSGADRAGALRALQDALGTTRVAGVETNARFLAALAAHPAFAEGELDTHFIDRYGAELLDRPPADERVYIAASLWIRQQRRAAAKSSPWDGLGGWRLNQAALEYFWFRLDEELVSVVMMDTEPALHAVIGGKTFAISGSVDGGAVQLTIENASFEAHIAAKDDAFRLWHGADYWDLAIADPFGAAADEASVPSTLTAPMPGSVTAVNFEPGAKVMAGDTVMTMEAMKMEHAIKAPHAGTIIAYRFGPSEQVKQGDLLLDFEEDES